MERKRLENVCALFVFILAGFTFVWTACDDKDTIATVGGIPLAISANIQEMGGGESYRFEGGESVGMWVSSTDDRLEQADLAQNVKFYQSAAGLVSEPRTYSGNHQHLYLYGYYPFDSAAVVSPQAYRFSVEPDQRKASNMVASDLLWAYQTVSEQNKDEKIRLDFSHLMSKLVINVRGSYPDAGGLRECRAQLVDVLVSASVNLKEGSVMPMQDKATVEAMSLAAIPDNYESSLQAVVVPQTFNAGSPLLKVITKGNVTNEWMPEQDIVLSSGMQLVLDVLIEEEECYVTIKEILPWDMDDEVLQAEAIEKNPSYELFEFYSRFGVQGIVIALDEGTDGQHGWIISTDEAELAWGSTEMPGLKGFSRTDAATNLKLALEEDPTLEKFPAMKWCDDKNQTRTTLADLEQNGIEGRWVLLPVTELKAKFGDQFLAYNKTSNHERLNTAIENASVSSSLKMELPEINWNDWSVMISYWSSSYVGQNVVSIVQCAVNDHMYFGGSGVYNSVSEASVVYKVRAFYHF